MARNDMPVHNNGPTEQICPRCGEHVYFWRGAPCPHVCRNDVFAVLNSLGTEDDHKEARAYFDRQMSTTEEHDV